MKKKDLIEKLANELGMSKTQTEVMFEEMFAAISKILEDGETVSIPRFGKFEISQTNARVGRNPKTGESIDIPEKNKVKFRPSQKLKEMIQ